MRTSAIAPHRRPAPEVESAVGQALQHPVARGLVARSWRKWRMFQLLLLGAWVCCGIGQLRGVDVERLYTGSGISLESAVSTAQTIVVGSIEKYGSVESDGPNAHSMTEVEIKIDKPLWGDSSDHITVSLRVQAPSPLIPKGDGDPHVGTSYVFFIKKIGNDGYDVIKLLESNDDLAKKIEDLIATRGKK